MKKIAPLLCCILWLACCTSKPYEVVEERYYDDSPKVVKLYTDSTKTELLKEIQYYPNKKIHFSGGYKDGQRDGYWVYYFENGNKWSEGDYKNGQNHGKRTTYHENGQVYMTGEYKNNEMAGKWTFYDSAGNIVGEKDFGNR